MDCARENRVIKTQFLNKLLFVPIHQKDLTDFEAYIEAVNVAFNIEFDKDTDVYLCDQTNARIPPELFGTIVTQFIGCSNFTIKITTASNVNDGQFYKELEYFLTEQNVKFIFVEYGKTDNLSMKSIRKLCNELIKFIDHKFQNPNREGIEAVCRAAIKLFPCLEQQPSGNYGIDLLYNARNKSGLLYYKMVYKKYGKGAQEIENSENGDGCVMDVGTDEKDIGTDDLTYNEELEHLLFFRTCVVSRDKEILKIRMKQTISLREKTLKTKLTKFPEIFPFYFVSPDLILYDYELRFEKIDSQALINKWPKIEKNLLFLIDRIEVTNRLKMFNDSIGYFLILLQSFTIKKKLEDCINKLIVFTDDMNGNPEDYRAVDNIYPHIIAVGKSKSDITNYYIFVEGNLICVPIEFDFLRTMDLFMKIHRVFHVYYNPALKNMFNFIEFFIFNQKLGITPTTTMHKIAKKLVDETS